MKIAVVALTLCSIVSVAFAGTEVSHRKFRDESARIEYSWIENCTNYQLTVTAAKTRLKQDGVTVDDGPSASITYSTYNFCDLANPEQTFWFGTAPAPSFQIDGNLRSARLLVAAFPLRGSRFQSGVYTDLGTASVAVDISWSSNDPIDKYSGTVVTHYPGYHEVSHLNGHYRLATASGVIFDGVKNLVPTLPESGFVQMYRLTQGETILIKD